MTKFYSINALCKLTKVSIRTLHYYDEINLLKPSHRTNSNHRLYAETDLLRLQQIVTFRFLGFSLSQIKKILGGDQFSVLNLLKMQANAVADEAIRIEKVSKFFNYLINQQELQGTIDWQSVINIIDILKQKEMNTEQWYENYFTTMELQQFQKFAKKRTTKWTLLLQEVRENLNSDPESEIGLELIKKWMALVDEAYGNHPELKKKLCEIFKSGAIPHHFFLMTKTSSLICQQLIKKCNVFKLTYIKKFSNNTRMNDNAFS